MTEWTDPQNIIAVGTIFIAILALFVSCYSITQSKKSLEQQQRHDRLSVRSIGQFTVLDGNDKIGILFHNHGTGPLMIKSIEMFNEKDQKERNNKGELKNYPIDWIDQKYRDNVEHEEYTEHTALFNGPNPMKLLYFEFNLENSDQQEQRKNIRALLKNLKIEIRYTDIYNEYQGISGSTFEYFGRTRFD